MLAEPIPIQLHESESYKGVLQGQKQVSQLLFPTADLLCPFWFAR
jgi:hypothetical protein